MLANLTALPMVIEPQGVSIRWPLSFERAAVERFVAEHFAATWADEINPGLSRMPPTVFVAVREGKIVGFAGWDCTARGFFGPTGVAESERGNGIGKALLLSSLWRMRNDGYAYAVIGGIGPADFYTHTVGAFVIPDSDPGIYRDMLT